MSMVTLVSGGLDSTLMAVLAKEEGLEQLPLFLDYGQRASRLEWTACRRAFKKLKLPEPVRMNLRGFGQIIPSGLTNAKLRLNEDAFLPGRNLLFLLAGGSYAYKHNCNAVAIGLLSQRHHLFPDQTREFLKKTEKLFALTFGRRIRVTSPLIRFAKKDVAAIAKRKGISGTYSCHSGRKQPCGKCISCLEFVNAGIKIGGKNGR